MPNKQPRQARAEAESESERELYDSTPVGCFSIGRDGTIQEANLIGTHLLGVGRSALINRRLRQFVCEESRPAFDALVEKSFAGQGRQSCDLTICAAGNQRLELLFSAAASLSGKTCQVAVVDITESMKRAERRLAEARQQTERSERRASEAVDRLNESQEVAGIGSWDWDLETDCVWWSDQTYRLFDVRPEQYVPGFESNAQFIHPEDLGRYRAQFEHSLQTGEPLDLEVRLVGAGGERVRCCRALGRCSRGPSGKPVRFVGVLIDITDRRQADAELRAANARLEQALARAEELAVRAEAASRAKSEFLANMSHELRTPMTAVLGFCDLLASPDLSRHEQSEFLGQITQNGKALLDLLGDVLDFSQIEADRLTLGKMDCPLRPLIDDVLAMVRLRAEQKGLQLEVACATPLPQSIHTDPLRLRQILVNLVGNAVKFTEHGCVRITLSCTWQPGEAARMQFAISDTGIGIAADKIGELFSPFTQLDGSSTRRYGGTGLGLAISKRLAKALGGDVEVTSRQGEGSTFTLSIDAGSPRSQ